MMEKNSLEFLSPNNISEKVLIDKNNIKKQYIEIAHIFDLETVYSQKLSLYFKDKNNNNQNIYMSSYGIGIYRIMFIMTQKIYNGVKGVLDIYFSFLPKQSTTNNLQIKTIYKKYKKCSIYFDCYENIAEVFNFSSQMGIIYVVTYYNNIFEITNLNSNEVLKLYNYNQVDKFISKQKSNIKNILNQCNTKYKV